MSTVSVNISKLPVAKEINNGDYLIIDNGIQTSRLDFKDFIITSENTTFNGGSSTSVTNINALKNVSTSQLQTGAIVNVLGYYAAGDLGGGVFYYEPTAVSNDNGGTIIRPNSGVGRWLRLLNGYSYVTPQMFGAKGDGVTDDRAAIQACIDAVTASAVKLSIKAIGTYLVSSRLIITANFRSQFQGTNTGYGLPATVFYVDSTTEPLFELRSVVHATFSDFAVYFKRPTSDTITTDENAYCFLARGWLYFSRVQNIDCFWNAGFLRCAPLSAYDRGESLMFSCWVSNVRSSFGRIGIEIGPGLQSAGGSGTSFNDVYLSNSGINYGIQAPAICAIKYGTSAVNDEWERLNVEWTRFSGDVVIISGQVHFASPHFEGLTFADSSSEHSFYSIINTVYSNVSIDNGIIQSSGRVFNIPGVLRVNIFKDGSGFGNNTLTVTNFEIYNLTSNVGTEIHRLRVERAMRFSGTGIREIETTFHDTSVNWDCMSEIPSCVSRTVNIEDHFVSGFATTMQRITAYGTPDGFVTERYFGQWNLSRVYTPPIPDIIADPFSPNKRVGVLRLQSGTTQYTSNILSLSNTKIKIGQGPISIRAGFALSRFGTIDTKHDNYIFAIGLAENVTDVYGKAIMFWVNSYTVNQQIAIGTRNPPTYITDTGFSGGPISTPNQWNDFELVINPDATVLSFWVASRDGRGQPVGGIVTGSAIPLSANLTPFITIQKSGSAAATNDIAYVDYFRVSYQPVGLNGV